MEKWNDTLIQRSIDDIIEESYLMTLPEDAIREYLRDFVTACESVIRHNATIHGDIRLTKVKITLLRSYLYLNRKLGGAEQNRQEKEGVSSQNDLFAHNVFKIKSTTLRILDTIDSSYVEAVLREEKELKRAAGNDSEIRGPSLKHEALYSVLLFLTLLLLAATVFY